MAIIHFKGNRAAIEVPEERGKVIQTDWLDGKLPNKIVCENIDGGMESFLADDIRAVQTQKELDKVASDEGKSEYSENFTDWLLEQEELKNNTAYEKAQINVEQVLTTAMDCIGKNLTDDAKYAILDKYQKFFEDNPERLFVDFDTHIQPFIINIDKELSAFNLRVLEVIGYMCARDKN